MLWITLLLAQTAVTPQIDRGEALFHDATKGCASCHALKGRGAAVGPDLKNIGGLAPPAIAVATRSTITSYVQNVKLKSKESFPAMPGAKDEKTIQLYDLSKTPAELRKIERTEIESMTNNDTWKHPPLAKKYTDEQMADIVAYIRYAVTGSRKSVDPSEVR
jgi:mono/diheme cytochrome c family protein